MKFETYLSVGPVIFHIFSEEAFSIGENCSHFFRDSLEQIDHYKNCRLIECRITRVEKFRTLTGQVVYQNPERMIFEHHGREQRLHAAGKDVFGIYYENDDNSIDIELSKEIVHKININIFFLEMLAMERFLIKENAIVLHSSFIQWNQKGIVFSAPSGTGKSTQAELWRKYAGSQIINGDRSVLYKDPADGTFKASGIPFCGSSKINLYGSFPLEAVVFLSQSRQNSAKYYPSMYAVQKIFSETSMNQWNKNFVESSLTFIQELSETVKMIGLSCNISPEAVEELKKYL